MGFEEGQLVLNSANGTFCPGEMLSGRLEFDLTQDLSFRGIYVEVKGQCKVQWTTRHRRRVKGRVKHSTRTHESQEDYMNMCIYLIGSQSGEVALYPGHHVFTFECQIPAHCPSSFEGSVGYIRYKVKVTVSRAFKLDLTKEISFRVVAPVDLNTNPRAKEPMVFQLEQSFCCWCMSAGLVETIVKLPASGFVPRQVIPIEVACSNNSNVEVTTIRFRIKKTLRFEVQHEPDTRYSEDIVAELKKGPIPGNTTRNYYVEMELPDMDVPKLDACRFIHVDYDFEVEVETSDFQNEVGSRRLFIGTIPIAGLQYPSNSNFETANNMQRVTSYSAAPVVNQPLFNTEPFPDATFLYSDASPENNSNIELPTPPPPYPEACLYPDPPPYPVGQDPSYSAGDAVGNNPYADGNTGANLPNPGLKTGADGFTEEAKEAMPLLPHGAEPMPQNPYASASAPPLTPDEEHK